MKSFINLTKKSSHTKINENILTAVATLVKKNGKLISKQVKGCARFSTESGKCDLFADTSTRFILGSNSKHMMVAVILMLEEEGRLSLEDEISKFFKTPLPSSFRGIKIKHLIFHTAGTGDFLDELLIEKNPDFADATELKPSDLAIIVQELIKEKNHIAFSESDIWKSIINEKIKPFGKESIYSNSGYHLLSKIIESVEQDTFEEIISRRIFAKLGMKDASFIMFSKNTGNQASIYLEYPILEATLPKIFKYVKGEGSFAMSIDDYEKWINAIDDGTLFKRGETLQKFLSVGTYDDGKPIDNFNGQQGLGYGYGMGFLSDPSIIGGKQVIFHNGGFDIVVASFLHEPETKTWVVKLYNYNSQDFAEYDDAIDLFNDTYFGNN